MIMNELEMIPVIVKQLIYVGCRWQRSSFMYQNDLFFIGLTAVNRVYLSDIYMNSSPPPGSQRSLIQRNPEEASKASRMMKK